MTTDASIPEWHHGLSVGNADLDQQHIELLELGRAVVQFYRERSSSKEQIRQMLQDIVNLTRRHDAMEEAVLAHNRCPSLAAHHEAHESARAALSDLLDKAEFGAFNADAAIDALSNWMSHHIGEYDLQVKAYLKHPQR